MSLPACEILEGPQSSHSCNAKFCQVYSQRGLKPILSSMRQIYAVRVEILPPGEGLDTISKNN